MLSPVTGVPPPLAGRLLTDEREDLLRRAVRESKRLGRCLRQNLCACHVGGFRGEICVADGALCCRGVLECDAEA